jgi:hypothetical protein
MARSNHVYRRFPSSESAEDIFEWATYCAGRYPQFKMHQSIGPAKAAITSTGHGIMYRRMPTRDGQLTWQAVAVVNGHEQPTHPYRKLKPAQLTEPVVLFKITEEEELRDVA